MYNSYQYGQVPKVHKGRSRFNLSERLFTTAKVGELIPLYCKEVLPGDTFKLNLTSVIRTSSPFLKPVMDNAFFDMHVFFVPNRLIDDSWINVMGENTESAWAQTREYFVPTTTDVATVSSGSLGDYFGLPIGSVPKGLNLLRFRAYAKVFNDWWAQESVIDPVFINKGETASAHEVLNNNPFSPNNYMGRPAIVSKLSDYFTTCNPAPQKSLTPVELLLNFNDLPVIPRADIDNSELIKDPAQFISLIEGTDPTGMAIFDDGNLSFGDDTYADPVDFVVPTNLVALADNFASGININDFRFALATQRLLERDSRYGSRYVEYLEAAFGVISPDARLARSEYLGGKRIPINVQQVAQTSQGTGDSALADVGAFSLTNGNSRITKSFQEHGWLLCLGCLKSFHSYQNGVERSWTRNKRLDYYDPEFAFIGDTPVYKSELYADGGTVLNSAIFGYNESWADYKSGVSKITGQMRSGIDNSLDIYHFGDYYENAPTLNDQFIHETGIYVDRTLSVGAELQDPFIINCYAEVVAYRCMPTYSVPSLVGWK